MGELDKVARKQRETIVVKKFGGIVPSYEAFYIQSIIYAAERSSFAFQQFDAATEESEPAFVVFSAVQDALTHAGALSRFFWPVRKDSGVAVARGERLRKGFNLDDSSPLKQRGLRNAFEHFDEKLDRFLIEDRAGYFFPNPVLDHHTLADDALGHIFKLVDPWNGICVLLGEKFEFLPVRREIEGILAAALEMDKSGRLSQRTVIDGLQAPSD